MFDTLVKVCAFCSYGISMHQCQIEQKSTIFMSYTSSTQSGDIGSARIWDLESQEQKCEVSSVALESATKFGFRDSEVSLGGGRGDLLLGQLAARGLT